MSYLTLLAIITYQGATRMTLDDLEREITKVTQQGGIARVSQETLMEAAEGGSEAECQAEIESWMQEFCQAHFLKIDHDKDMFGQTETLFFHGPEFHGHG